MTLEMLHEINPTGQRGIWKHSQNVESDLLKRYVVQVKRENGWLAMKSFDNEYDAGAYCVSNDLLDLFPGNNTVRVWDDKMMEANFTFITNY